MSSKRGREDVGPGTRLTSGPGEWVMVAGTSWWYRWSDKDCFPGGHSWYISVIMPSSYDPMETFVCYILEGPKLRCSCQSTFSVHALPGKTITKLQILLKRKLLGCSGLQRMLIYLAGTRKEEELICIKCQLHTLISSNPTITLQGSY